MNISDNKLNKLMSKTINLAQKKLQRRRFVLASSMGVLAMVVAVFALGAFLDGRPLPDLTVDYMPIASENIASPTPAPQPSITNSLNAIYDMAVCKIGNARYTSFEDALAEVQSGQTVTLLLNIKYTHNVIVTNKNIIFDLNGYSLNVEVSEGNALSVSDGASVKYINPGAFNVKTTANGGIGVYAEGKGSSAQVTNTEAHGDDVNAAYAAAGGMITVYGDAIASGIYIHSAEANGEGSSIRITGDVIANGDGKQVPDGIYVSMAVGAINGGSVKVAGNVTATGNYIYGAGTDNYSENIDTTIKVDGDVIVTGDNNTGAFAQLSGCITMVGGNVSVNGKYSDAVRAMNNAVVEVAGSITAKGSGSNGVVERFGGIVRTGNDATLLSENNAASTSAPETACPTPASTPEPTPEPTTEPTSKPTKAITPELNEEPASEPALAKQVQATPVWVWLIIGVAVVAAAVISTVVTVALVGRIKKEPKDYL